MTGAGGSLGAWGSLVLLVTPNPVRNLTVKAQTTSSITLSWEAPEGPDPQNSTYWVECTGDSGTTETRNTTDTIVTVDELEPGSLYKFSVWVEENGVNSSEETVTTATGKRRAEKMQQVLQSRRYTVEAMHVNFIKRNWPACLYKKVLKILSPETATDFPSHTASAPNPVRNLTVEAQTTSSITLSWEAPEGPDPQNSTYWVECTGDAGTTETRSTTNTTVTVDGLEPGSLYACSVWVQKNGINSSQETRNATTGETRSPFVLSHLFKGRQQEKRGDCPGPTPAPFVLYLCSLFLPNFSAPNPVRNLHVKAQTNSSIALSWEAPRGPDDQDYTYWVECTGDGRTETQNTTDTSATAEGLAPGTSYTFSVWAEKNGALGSRENLSISTGGNPQCPLPVLVRGSELAETHGTSLAPSEVMDLQNKTQTDNSVTLWWQAPRDPHSQLYVYRVQWASEGQPQREQDPQVNWANQSSRTNETWYKVEALEPGTLYNFTVWAERNNMASSTQSIRVSTNPDTVTITSCVSTSGGYGVILTWSCPQGGYEAFESEVGGQRGSQDRASCGKGVSVLGLGPAQSYPATITTIWDGMRATSASVTCHTESAGPLVAASLPETFILIPFPRNKKNQQKAELSDLAFSFPGYILAEDFADHVRKNEKDSNCGFAEEYQQLSLVGTSQSQMVASTPENNAKNRYRNVLPYDWSRVPLKPIHEEPGSDYINASFMPGLWSPQEFIATQGPLPQTVGDFWRLVWEQQSHTLVMLTNCMEAGRVKCEHYWPLDSQPCTHGHLRVTLESEEVTENWTVRELQLLQVEEQKTLSVRQFHYLAWPDHGVPSSPDTLLAFWRMLRQWLDQTMEGGPPIVHCSAGVGRTGTLIALDVLLRQLECEGLLGPFSFVKKMRESRPLMVQTEAQYVFLHQCILRFLQQSAQAPAEKEVTYENIGNLIYENEAAIRAHELEV
uniref:Receptor-type tyrosine-protein phosphatase H n=1 Tax=Aotus nancymaae TaxID=37293 RepID=A0A2K5CAT5_AOTNA